MAVAGNSRSPIYSCSKLRVLGGDPNLKCSGPNNIPEVSDCVKASSPDQNALLANAKPGEFCFNFDGVKSVYFLKFSTLDQDSFNDRVVQLMTILIKSHSMWIANLVFPALFQ